MEAPVLVSTTGDIGWVVLNRPQALNAITIDLTRALEHALVTLGETVHVIVVRGSAGTFSVGGDFKELERLRAAGTPAMAELFDSFGRACAAIAGLPVPVIAAVEGYALAGGFELMQACDFAVVREDAQIGDNHTNFSQVPGGGSSQRLPRLVGRQRALGLILSGDRISGSEAAAWGLAYRAVPADGFDAAIEELVQRLAAKSGAALARAKRLVYDGMELPLHEGLAMERHAVLDHLTRASAAHGIAAFTSRGGD